MDAIATSTHLPALAEPHQREAGSRCTRAPSQPENQPTGGRRRTRRPLRGGSPGLSGTRANDTLLGARALAGDAHVVAEARPVLVALHPDHCRPRTSTTGCAHRWPSQDDGSRSAPSPVSLAHVRRVGAPARGQHGIAGPATGREELYTTPDELLCVAEA